MAQPQIIDLFDERRSDYGDPDRPRPIRTYLWEPEALLDSPPPVVLISHGTGGSARQMTWLGEALATAGFVVVAVDHHGNNHIDGYLPQGFTFMWDRPADLTVALNALSDRRPLGPVGAAGFSVGGYTAAALLGARIDADAFQAVVSGLVPLPEIPEFPGLLEALHEAVPAHRLAKRLAESGNDVTDQRVRAAFLICPAIGQLMDQRSLAAIRRPVEIRWGGADTITRPEQHALRYLAAIPGATGRSAGDDVEHYDFLDDNPDCKDVRKQVAADAVNFFRGQLGPD